MSLIASYLTQTQQVTLRPRLAVYTAYGGSPTYGPELIELARVQEVVRMVRNATGELVQSVADVLLRPEAYVRPGDACDLGVLWDTRNWDDGTHWGGATYQVVAVAVARRLDGSARHQVAYLGK